MLQRSMWIALAKRGQLLPAVLFDAGIQYSTLSKGISESIVICPCHVHLVRSGYLERVHRHRTEPVLHMRPELVIAATRQLQSDAKLRRAIQPVGPASRAAASAPDELVK